MHSLNRRQILQLTFGATAASLLSACAAGSTAKPAAPPAPTSAPPAATSVPQTQGQPTAAQAAQPTAAAAQAAPAAAAGKVSIEYWQYFFQSKQDMVNTLIEDFQRQNPNIEIVHNSTIPYEQYQQ